MKSSQLRARYRKIIFFFARATANIFFWDIFLSRLGLRPLARKTRSKRLQKLAVQFRALAIEMGGVMIKVGQFLSSRQDVLPPEIVKELSGLQDEVPPEDFDAIREKAERELGGSLDDIFASFDAEPMAAASLGQVHRARLREAESFSEIVVKVQRPHIEKIIDVDLSALRRVGGWLERYPPVRKRADVHGLIDEFATTIYEEIDYLAEGENIEVFQENFLDDSRVHVPHVVWNFTTKRVLTMEDVFAIKITDYDGITAAGIDRAEVARILLDTYLKQIFEDGFFHADPHPGNLFVTPLPNPNEDGAVNWKLTFIDFGMVGRVPDNLRAGLRELVIAVGTRDAKRMVRAYQQLGILLPGANLKLIEEAESQVFDQFWGKSMSELRDISLDEMRQFAKQFRELMYEMPFQIPHNLLLLGRTVAILSGMCTGLHVDFNLWDQLVPYAKKLISEEATSNTGIWLNELGDLAKAMIALPTQLGRVLDKMESGNLEVHMPRIAQQNSYLEQAVYRLAGTLIFGSLFIGGIILRNTESIMIGNLLLATSLGTLFWTIFFARGHSVK
ncbi:MAG: AarF/ABC1/UbiB kinase family protein [Anaerolineae bacterium]|jgi:predicted unusual protein kinase regulating ubiquinone biosynthesis (AarF/ABC1/UbiB family)|nr:AarF/ABC1/UbiB kinase family protein [Anaerolineae bacterium]MBT4309045.1 AarF/ABC1/UbiB kinase family protein [Anaerolineae bacterium]MBT4460190.1 AarF/ABC1/UbiB kinase family protein [Anaerolineae bacterium]MBT6062520.1 AarF/ABC1/UbiB kinase family protein [Anaerolineae bacterium]MBT6321505.1 AarF/ABC1/UbiB kinase family protein [Anaerolineae bacterium]